MQLVISIILLLLCLIAAYHMRIQILQDAADAKKQDVGTSLVMLLLALSILNSPLNWFHNAVTKNGKNKFAVELWISGRTLVALVVLSFAHFGSIIIPLVLLVLLLDPIFALLRLVMINYPVKSVARSLFFLFVDYWHIVICFAGLYIFTQSEYVEPLFLINNTPGKLNIAQALYFSAIAGTTTGFGDIAVNSANPNSMRLYSLIIPELAILIAMVLVSFPRVLARQKVNR